ncbi:MAG: hypothetical protein K0R10_2985 [Alphaproteobacteria bacterium]|jgi:hypothetical protein|nr:hypothetical protein [Alphaproteobacteria bacterium]
MKKPDKNLAGLISPQVLADIGRAAFGVQWQPQLARALKVPEQHIRRWTNDGAPVDNLSKLRLILDGRTEEISRMAKQLDEYDVKE